MKKGILVLICVLFVFSFVIGCSADSYNDPEFIGKDLIIEGRVYTFGSDKVEVNGIGYHYNSKGKITKIMINTDGVEYDYTADGYILKIPELDIKYAYLINGNEIILKKML